ncbi:transposase, partial [Glycomyces paridis]
MGRNSMLRLVRALPDPVVGATPVLGVDDFAFRRGHTYGTILIDMASHRPIELLDGRDAAPLQAWLRAHPGVEVICRDRSSSYAEAARTAAPDAIQVADRFHLWHNLIDAVEECIMRHRSAFTEPLVEATVTEPDPLPEQPETPADPTGKMAENRRVRHQRVHDLIAEGHSLRAITRHLGWSRNTVRRYANADRWQDMVTTHRPRDSKLDPYKPYLHDQWLAGRTNVVELDREIRALGYRGSYSTVADYLAQFRPDRPQLPPINRAVPPTVRTVTGWLTRHP